MCSDRAQNLGPEELNSANKVTSPHPVPSIKQRGMTVKHAEPGVGRAGFKSCLCTLTCCVTFDNLLNLSVSLYLHL